MVWETFGRCTGARVTRTGRRGVGVARMWLGGGTYLFESVGGTVEPGIDVGRDGRLVNRRPSRTIWTSRYKHAWNVVWDRIERRWFRNVMNTMRKCMACMIQKCTVCRTVNR